MGRNGMSRCRMAVYLIARAAMTIPCIRRVRKPSRRNCQCRLIILAIRRRCVRLRATGHCRGMSVQICKTRGALTLQLAPSSCGRLSLRVVCRLRFSSTRFGQLPSELYTLWFPVNVAILFHICMLQTRWRCPNNRRCPGKHVFGSVGAGLWQWRRFLCSGMLFRPVSQLGLGVIAHLQQTEAFGFGICLLLRLGDWARL